MAVTRDPDFSPEAAQLMQAFNRCADGHGMQNVIEAAANMFSAALHNYCRMKKMSDAEALEFARDGLRRTLTNFEMNWKRKGATKPGDVEVKAN